MCQQSKQVYCLCVDNPSRYNVCVLTVQADTILFVCWQSKQIYCLCVDSPSRYTVCVDSPSRYTVCVLTVQAGILFVCRQSKQIDIVYPEEEGADGLLPALKRICQESAEAARSGYKLIILSDRKASPEMVPVRWAVGIGEFPSWLQILLFCFIQVSYVVMCSVRNCSLCLCVKHTQVPEVINLL